MSRPVLLRLTGIACLLANVGIGIWFASTESSLGQRALVMSLLAVLLVVGLLCLANAARLAPRRRVQRPGTRGGRE